jgi:flagellar hook protein FlgE
MAVSALGGINAVGALTPESSVVTLRDFIQILTTQLSLQDPLKPVDNEAFVAQLAQFTNLEQTRLMSTSVDTLVSVQATAQTVALIGKTVEVSADGGPVAGTVTAVTFGAGPLGGAMFEAIHIGLTGLSSFSRNLTVIGNNVANLNSPGFKASQLAFSELVYRNALSQGAGGTAPLQVGAGVGSSGSRVMFRQGNLQQTGQDSDLAVSGDGFFVLRDANGRTTYTRDGQFQFDAAGFLVSRTGARVAALAGGSLQDLSIAALRNNAPRATSVVELAGNLSIGDSDGIHETSVTVFDASGGSHALTLRFTNNTANTPRQWLVEVRNASGTVIHNGAVNFDPAGTPVSGPIEFNLASPGAGTTRIRLDVGTAGSIRGLTNFSGGISSDARSNSQDGFGFGTLTRAAFDVDGVLTATYSNGQTARGQRIALALFSSPEELVLSGNGGFENLTGQEVVLGTPRLGPFGSVAGQSLEAANVDLAQQFSELIISQRGFQASSQIVGTANEMIQQLFDMRSKR